MPVTREKKEKALAALEQEFGRAGSAIFTDFRGVDVAGITDLRAKLRAQGARYVVAKRTLAELSLRATPADQRDALLTGATGICFADAEPIAVAKILADFRKDYEAFGIKGALLGAKFLNASAVGTLATTPSREILLGRLLGAMNGPASQFVGVLAGVMRQFVGTLRAVADQKGEAA